MKNIAIFASGSGTNAQNIVEYFINNKEINISLILSNNKNAFVLKRAEKLNIPFQAFDKSDFYKSSNVLDLLKDYSIDFIVLAGFLWLIPSKLIKEYSCKIVNIHPALLPKYGGKGMYGMKVHEAVKASGEIESGISIHYVNEKYDEGEIIFQATINVLVNDTPESIAQKIHKLEYKHFPEIIENCVNDKLD